MTLSFLCLALSAVPALDGSLWNESVWISAADAPVVDRSKGRNQLAAEGTSWFASEVVPGKAVAKAVWMTTAHGVYEIYVNGRRIGSDILKPGYTTACKTRYSFTYDVTAAFKCGAGVTNVLAAEVSSGWWRDYMIGVGRKSAFRGVLELTHADGSKRIFGTNLADWKASGKAGPVRWAGIYEGEGYDARVPVPVFGDASFKSPERNGEYTREILPSPGGEVCYRDDLALKPVAAYCWKGVTGASCPVDAVSHRVGKDSAVYGTVVKTRSFDPKGPLEVLPGETLVVDFGQNCAGVPDFAFTAAAGTVLTCLPAEMLNDANGERSRGNDGPAGSVYRENLRMAANCMRNVYTFAGHGEERYRARFSFFGYRYVSITATAPVRIASLRSVPVTSVSAASELGKIVTGDRDVNRLIANAYWGQLSNYLSVPTDCPQRNERRGWTADTQVFAEAGTYNADTAAFFRKWMRDVRDASNPDGTFPDTAPGWTSIPRVGWSDAGVIVPWTVWKQFGDTRIVAENFAAMEKWMALIARTNYRTKRGTYQYADWLSFEEFETRGWFEKYGKAKLKEIPEAFPNYWDYLGGCYWIYDAMLMRDMSAALGKADAAARYAKMEAEARESVRARFLDADGRLPEYLRTMQTPYVMAIKMGLFRSEKERRAGTEALLANIRAKGDCISTGFLGTSFILDALTEAGHPEVAYTLLLQHKFPSWLYSVDQGATTIWERWNGYTKKDGFGPVGMNSFNHYAYGAVLAWIYKTAAGIASDPAAPGFRRILMAPKPDRRLGSVAAEYRTPHGVVKSAWKYEGDTWVWTFTVPAGTTARVTLPGEAASRDYAPGTYTLTVESAIEIPKEAA